MTPETPTTTIATRCDCGNDKDIVVAEDDFLRWRSGTHAQTAFPYLSADDRERLITGTCPACWDRMFADDWTAYLRNRRRASPAHP